jgi:restriction endonuclease
MMTIWSGKSYERQVMQHLSETHKGIEFELDIKLSDTTNSYTRQIDVWLPKTREIIECKHLARPVGVGVVDSLIGAVQDIEAAGGHIFSSSGFSRQAQLRAAKAGIKCTTLPFESRVKTYFPPSGGGYYTGDYADLCMAATQDCDHFGRINYTDGEGDQWPICVGFSIDWGNFKMRNFVAHILLAHLLGRPPSDSTIDDFVHEYGGRFEAGKEWIITEREASYFTIAEAI